MKEAQQRIVDNSALPLPSSSLDSVTFKAQESRGHLPTAISSSFVQWFSKNSNLVAKGKLPPEQARIFIEHTQAELPSISAMLHTKDAPSLVKDLGRLWRTSSLPEELAVPFKIQIGKVLYATASVARAEALPTACIKNLRLKTIDPQMLAAVEVLAHSIMKSDASPANCSLNNVGKIIFSEWSLKLISSDLPQAKNLHNSLIEKLRPLLGKIHDEPSLIASHYYKEISLYGTALAAFLYAPSTQAAANLTFSKMICAPNFSPELLIDINNGAVPLSNSNIDTVLTLHFLAKHGWDTDSSAYFIAGLLSLEEQQAYTVEKTSEYLRGDRTTLLMQAVTYRPSLWRALAEPIVESYQELYTIKGHVDHSVLTSNARCFSEFVAACHREMGLGSLMASAFSHLAENSRHSQEFTDVMNDFILHCAFSNVSDELRASATISTNNIRVDPSEIVPIIKTALNDQEQRQAFLSRLSEWPDKEQERILLAVVSHFPEQWMSLRGNIIGICRWQMKPMPAKDRLNSEIWEENLVESLLYLSQESFAFAESKINRLIELSPDKDMQIKFKSLRDQFADRYAAKVWDPIDPEPWIEAFLQDPLPPLLPVFNTWAAKKGLNGEELLRESRFTDTGRAIPELGIQGCWPQCADENCAVSIKTWIAKNIQAIERLDARVPGGVSFLYDNYGIRNFARYPLELLENQIQTTKEAITGKKITSNPVILSYPLSDWNGAFMNAFEANRVSEEQTRRQRGLPAIVFESKNVVELLIFAHRTTRWFGKSQCGIIAGHGDLDGVRLTHEGNVQGSDLQRKHLEDPRVKLLVRELFSPGACILLSSCGTGAEGGFAERLSDLFDGMGVKVIAPRVPGYLDRITFRGKSSRNMRIEAIFKAEEGVRPLQSITRIIETDLASLPIKE